MVEQGRSRRRPGRRRGGRRSPEPWLLKDWKTYGPGDSESGDIVFQGKHADGNWPSFYLMAKRNSIAFRSPTLEPGQSGLSHDVGRGREEGNDACGLRYAVRELPESSGMQASDPFLPSAAAIMPGFRAATESGSAQSGVRGRL
ncbi:hypothetical protein GA0115254_131575 [Streptomyces sp. Ncost-T10-10d]|nr:hypothetical protein GA0115254_131575 [Streptomyces sp. Ncost-T10-10d]